MEVLLYRKVKNDCNCNGKCICSWRVGVFPLCMVLQFQDRDTLIEQSDSQIGKLIKSLLVLIVPDNRKQAI